MQPGSVRVKVGDKVKTGQVLGLLGNRGNTDRRICISMSWTAVAARVERASYAFGLFTGQGRLTDEQPLFTGGVVTIDKDALPGPHANELLSWIRC